MKSFRRSIIDKQLMNNKLWVDTSKGTHSRTHTQCIDEITYAHIPWNFHQTSTQKLSLENCIESSITDRFDGSLFLSLSLYTFYPHKRIDE